MDGFFHFATIGWKFLFSIVPPPHYANGWLCFSCAIVMIGCVTLVV